MEEKPRYNYKRKILMTSKMPPLNCTNKMREDTEKACELLQMSLSDYLRMAIEEMNNKTLKDDEKI